MRLIKLALFIVAVTLFAIACNNTTTTTSNQTGNNQANKPAASPVASAQTPTTPADEFASTRAIYARECARCHNINGEGGTPEVLGKKLKVPSLKTGHALDHSEAQLAKQIRDGGDGMPAYKDRLKQDEIDGLVRFILKEFQGGRAAKK